MVIVIGRWSDFQIVSPTDHSVFPFQSDPHIVTSGVLHFGEAPLWGAYTEQTPLEEASPEEEPAAA